jgi:anti-anti-sigma factor
MLDVRCESSGDYARVTLRGDVDLSTTEQVAHAVGSVVDEGAAVVDVDLAAVEFIDSTGLGMLIRLRRTTEAAGVAFRLANCSERTLEVLRMTRLDALFTLLSED